MQRIIATSLIAAALALAPALLAKDKIVILHTNDTHSQLMPDDKGRGGIARRKVLVDSVRAVNPATILVDAGDAVQGTVYFTLFKGNAESDAMNALDYDFQIIGNHEFDNGLEDFARYWKSVKATPLATNYDFTGTPAEGLFRPWAVKEVAGHRIGFMGIGLDPHGMVADANFKGMRYIDAVEAANAVAWVLRNIERADLVVALTHIGYNDPERVSDVELARSSRNIDIIIGGHSHTAINPADSLSPACVVENSVGKPVLVTQTGKSGRFLGEITIDSIGAFPSYRLIPVDSRLDSCIDSSLTAVIEPYRADVDSVMGIRIGTVKSDMDQNEMTNFMADFVASEAKRLTGKKVDLAIVNKGGVRGVFSRGALTVGDVMQVFPFDNRIVLLEIKGSDLLDNLRIMTRTGGNGLSRGTEVVFSGRDKVDSAKINGREIDPARIYTLATIDYLANGGDYMEPLTRGKRIAASEDVIYTDMIEVFTSGSMKGRTLKADSTVRMHRP